MLQVSSLNIEMAKLKLLQTPPSRGFREAELGTFFELVIFSNVLILLSYKKVQTAYKMLNNILTCFIIEVQGLVTKI